MLATRCQRDAQRSDERAGKGDADVFVAVVGGQRPVEEAAGGELRAALARDEEGSGDRLLGVARRKQCRRETAIDRCELVGGVENDAGRQRAPGGRVRAFLPLVAEGQGGSGAAARSRSAETRGLFTTTIQEP